MGNRVISKEVEPENENPKIGIELLTIEQPPERLPRHQEGNQMWSRRS